MELRVLKEDHRRQRAREDRRAQHLQEARGQSKRRKPLDVKGFKEIHAKSPEFLQIAMEQSLITLQGRSEICNLEHSHYRDGWIYTIRDKTSGDSDMAFIRIQLSEQLDELHKRSLRLNVLPGHPGVASMDRSPFVVFHKPERRRKEWTKASRIGRM